MSFVSPILVGGSWLFSSFCNGFQPTLSLPEVGSSFTSENKHKYHVGDLVLRFIPRRGRSKDMDCYKGPYVVKKLIGNTSLSIGDYDRPRDDKTVFAGHIKPFYLPSTTGWTLHTDIFNEVLLEWGLQNLKEQYRSVSSHEKIKKAKKIIVTSVNMDLEPFLDIFERKNLQSLIMVVPHLPCMEWWKKAIRITASWVEISNHPDSFMVNDQPVGSLTFSSWIVRFKGKDMKP